ncbi:MAG: helix-turn-helix transcriptional regulator [Polyangiaceae bacterium]
MSPATFRRKVAERIRKARWRLGWTQADAAFRVGLTFRYFAEVERGRRNPSLDTLLAIARALKVKVVDLVDVEPGARVDLEKLRANPPKTGRKPTRVTRAK